MYYNTQVSSFSKVRDLDVCFTNISLLTIILVVFVCLHIFFTCVASEEFETLILLLLMQNLCMP